MAGTLAHVADTRLPFTAGLEKPHSVLGKQILDVRTHGGNLQLSPSGPTHRSGRFEEVPEVQRTDPCRFPTSSLNFRPQAPAAFKCLAGSPSPKLPVGPLNPARAVGGPRSALAPLCKLLAVSRDSLCPTLPAWVRLRSGGLAMRSRLLLSAARCLWARGAVAPARRHISCDRLQLEELFARGGPLRTFLERQAGSESQVRGPELVAIAKLLSERERELRETEHLLHGKRGSKQIRDSSFAFSTKLLVRCLSILLLSLMLFTQFQPFFGLEQIRALLYAF